MHAWRIERNLAITRNTWTTLCRNSFLMFPQRKEGCLVARSSITLHTKEPSLSSATNACRRLAIVVTMSNHAVGDSLIEALHVSELVRGCAMDESMRPRQRERNIYSARYGPGIFPSACCNHHELTPIYLVSRRSRISRKGKSCFPK